MRIKRAGQGMWRRQRRILECGGRETFGMMICSVLLTHRHPDAATYRTRRRTPIPPRLQRGNIYTVFAESD